MPKSSLALAPTAEYLRELHEHIAGTYWNPQREIDKKFTDLFYDQNIVPVVNTASKDRKMRVDPERLTVGEAARIIGLSGSFYSAPPKMDAEYSGADAWNANRAENAGRAWNEAIDQMNSPTGDQPWMDGVEEMHLYGRSCDFIVQTHLHFADYPFKKQGQSEADSAKERHRWKLKSPLPILWQTLPAISTFPAYLSTAEDEVLSELTTSYAALMGMFTKEELAGVMPEDAKKWYQECTLVTHSNRDFLTYSVLAREKAGMFGSSGYADKLLRTVGHGMGRCAIRIHPGLTSARKEPGYYWRSQLFAVLGLLETLDKLATAARTGAKFDVAPILVEYRNSTNADMGDGARTEVEEFMDIITLSAGDPSQGIPPERLDQLQLGQNNQQTRELMLYIERKIERITGAVEILEGGGGSNVTAWSDNFRAETAKSKLKPLTHRHIGRTRGVAESIQAALSAYGKDIPLTKRDENGRRIGSSMLKVVELEDYAPVLRGTYDAQLPMNERADFDMGMKAIAMILDGTVWGVSPMRVARRYLGSDEPWREEKEAQDVRYMRTPAVLKLIEDDIAEAFEAGLSEEDKMTMAQIEAEAQGLPQPTIEILKKFGIDAPGAPGMEPPGGIPPLMNATQGAVAAGGPYSQPAGGPNPAEQMGPVQ